MWIIDIFLFSSHEKEIERTIDCEGKYESCSENSEYRDRYICEELPEYPWQSHHGDEYDDRRHHSRYDRHSIFTKSKHDRRLWIISDSDLRTCSLHDHDDRIDRNTK